MRHSQDEKILFTWQPDQDFQVKLYITSSVGILKSWGHFDSLDSID